MEGITRCLRQEGSPDGLGARFSLRMHVGSADVGGVVEVVEFREPGDLSWTNVTGIDHRGRWRLRERADGRTEVTLRLSYEAPGFLGALSDRSPGRWWGATLGRHWSV